MNSHKFSKEILPGVFCIPLPLPGRKPGPVNVYLFKGVNNTLIDTGMRQTSGLLRRALKEHGLDFSDIDKILITHGHPDHFGAAKKIIRAGKGRVIAHAEDRSLIESGYNIFSPHYKIFLKLMGVPVSVRLLLKGLFVFFQQMAENCPVDGVVRDGDEIDIGPYRGRVIETPGHSKGSICVFLEREKALFCGDMIIEHITPNAFIMMDEDSVLPTRLSQEEFYKSLAKIKKLSPAVLYSAHGRAMQDVDDVVAGYEKAFAERKESVLSLVRDGQKSVYKIARLLFPEIRGIRLPLEIFLSISEVYTTIQVLQREGKVSFNLLENLLEIQMVS